jgi:hypothetical protein
MRPKHVVMWIKIHISIQLCLDYPTFIILLYLYVICSHQNLTVLNYVNSLDYKLEASIAGDVNTPGTFHLYSCVLEEWSVSNHQVRCFVQTGTLLNSEQVYFTKTQYKATWSSKTIPSTHCPSRIAVCKHCLRADTVILHKAGDIPQTLVRSTVGQFLRVKSAAWFPSPYIWQASFHNVTEVAHWQHMIYDDIDPSMYPQSVFIQDAHNKQRLFP